MAKVGREFLGVFLLSLFSGLFGYWIRILFARNLTVSEYGLFYAVYAFIFFFAPFRDLGLSESTVYYINKYLAKNDLRRVKGIIVIGVLPQLILGLVIAFILFILRNFLVIHFFKTPLAFPIYNILLLLFSFQTLYPSLTYLFLAYQDILWWKFGDTLKNVFILLFSYIFFLSFTNKIIVPPLANLLGILSAIIFLFVVSLFKYRDVLFSKMILSKSMTKDMFNYALPIMFSTAGGIVLQYSDVILLTFLKGSTLVGLYNIALPCVSILLIIFSPLFTYLFPKISKLYHSNKKSEIEHVLSFVYNYLMIPMLPLVFLFFSYPKLIIAVLFGSRYIPAYNILRVFSLSFVFMSLRNLNFSVIAGIGKAKERSAILYIGAGFNVVLDLILIPLFGATGAAISTGLGFVLMTYLTFKLIVKFYRIKIDYVYQLKVLFSSIIFLISISFFKYFIHMNVYLEAILVSIIASVIYVALLFMLDVISVDKIKAFKRLFF